MIRVNTFRLVNKYDLRMFFVNQTRYSVGVSHYSREKTTRSSRISTKNWFQHSLDEGKIRKLAEELTKAKAVEEQEARKVSTAGINN